MGEGSTKTVATQIPYKTDLKSEDHIAEVDTVCTSQHQTEAGVTDTNVTVPGSEAKFEPPASHSGDKTIGKCYVVQDADVNVKSSTHRIHEDSSQSNIVSNTTLAFLNPVIPLVAATDADVPQGSHMSANENTDNQPVLLNSQLLVAKGECSNRTATQQFPSSAQNSNANSVFPNPGTSAETTWKDARFFSQGPGNPLSCTACATCKKDSYVIVNNATSMIYPGYFQNESYSNMFGPSTVVDGKSGTTGAGSASNFLSSMDNSDTDSDVEMIVDSAKSEDKRDERDVQRDDLNPTELEKLKDILNPAQLQKLKTILFSTDSQKDTLSADLPLSEGSIPNTAGVHKSNLLSNDPHRGIIGLPCKLGDYKTNKKAQGFAESNATLKSSQMDMLPSNEETLVHEVGYAETTMSAEDVDGTSEVASVDSDSSSNTCDMVLLDMIAHDVDDEASEQNEEHDEVQIVYEDIKQPKKLETMKESNSEKTEEKKKDVDGNCENIVQCRECNKVFSDQDELESHTETSRKNRIPCDFKCDVCGEIHEGVRKFQNHRNLHFMKCDICNIHFAHPKCGKGHMRIHTGERPYRCDLCGLDFRDHSQYRVHKRKHEGIVENKHQCQICKKFFASRRSLITHGITHSGEKRFACEVCGKRFTQRSSVMLHMRLHAESEEERKPFQCEVCGQRFAQAGSMRSHSKVHEKDL